MEGEDAKASVFPGSHRGTGSVDEEKKMKKFIKFVLCAGVLAVGGLIAIQYQPVRDFAKKIGLPL